MASVLESGVSWFRSEALLPGRGFGGEGLLTRRGKAAEGLGRSPGSFSQVRGGGWGGEDISLERSAAFETEAHPADDAML